MSQLKSCLLCKAPNTAFSAPSGENVSGDVYLCSACKEKGGGLVERLQFVAGEAAELFDALQFDTNIPIEALPLEARPDRRWKLVLHRIHEESGALWNHFVLLSDAGEVRSVFAKLRAAYKALLPMLGDKGEFAATSTPDEVNWLETPWGAKSVGLELMTRCLEEAVADART